MATFTLDDIRAAAEKEYGNTEISIGDKTVTLRNALQLPKAERDALIAVQEQLTEDDADQYHVLAESLRIVAASKPAADALIKEIGDNLAVMLKVFEAYNERTQAGEA